MRAILIDPYTETITEVEGDFTKNREIYPHMKVSSLSTINFINEKMIGFIDDNGHLGPGKPCFIFKLYNPAFPLAGRMLLCGLRGSATTTLREGISIERIAKEVVWTDQESTGTFAGAGPTPTGYTYGHPVTRKRSA